MATTSFDKKFVVTDKIAADEFLTKLDNPRKVKTASRVQLKRSAMRGRELLTKSIWLPQ